VTPALLSGEVNDLIAILGIGAAGMGQDPVAALTTMLDVLLGVLRLDFACGRIEMFTGDGPLDLARLPEGTETSGRPEEICRALEPWLAGGGPDETARVLHPTGDGVVSIARTRLGRWDNLGVLLAGSSRPDFPTEFESFLLQVAASQATIGLLELRRWREEKHRATVSEEWLRRLADAIPEVVWITALHPEKVLYVSPSFERIWGLSTEDLYREPRLRIDTIHPDDRGRVSEQFSRWIAGENVGYQDVEYRIVQPGGAVRWIHERGVLFRDDQGRPYEVSGMSTDITERRESEHALEAAFAEIQELKDQLQQENIALREEIDKASMFEEIVGTSPALRAVLANISQVAPTDSTVLITGETGTGKELVARAIHRRSPRAGRPFVSVNCAAVPSSLIASELFGHEKGAFSGAVQRRQGRFELAAGGTIFLDEVADLPAETQVTLLRVLQEREFERLGSSRRIPADVRVIAASNRNLDAAVDDKTFRADLYYRLNVFPLEVPPLRERRSDIPLLVEYFTHRFAGRAGKRIGRIAKVTLDLFDSYEWPGNIRELQNVIERAVIVSEGGTLSVDEGWLVRGPAHQSSASLSLRPTLEAQERELILEALEAAKGRVSGPFGAATKLGMPASTLESKIKSLKIDKRRFRAGSAPPKS
jgi:formate hydrogenlyase transcriptional activator